MTPATSDAFVFFGATGEAGDGGEEADEEHHQGRTHHRPPFQTNQMVSEVSGTQASWYQ